MNSLDFSSASIAEMLAFKGKEAEKLRSDADNLTDKIFGGNVFLRGIIEVSNICSKDCDYCGIRRSNDKVKRYRMNSDEIKQVIDSAYTEGFRTVVLQAGEDNLMDENIAQIIEYAKLKYDISITLSLGERSEKIYRMWRDAGADRYLLRIETTNRNIFKMIHPDDDYEKRLNCLAILQNLGYETGTGVMIGLPKQTLGDLADDLLFFKKNKFDMLGFGPFIPHRETPLKESATAELDLVLNFTALCRLMNENANIPATTATGTLDVRGREMALRSGANVIMPNCTPKKFREEYDLYDNKLGLSENADDSLARAQKVVKGAGKELLLGVNK